MRFRFIQLGLLALLTSAAVGIVRADEPRAVPPIKPAVPASPPPVAPEAAGSPARPEVASSGSVTEVKPEIFYIRDKENQLVPVPGFTYEDFVKYYRLKEQLDRPDVKPRYNIEQLTLSGASESDRAELTATVKVLLIDSDWTRIPLKMNKCALREPAGYKGTGDEFLQFEPNGDGYVCWLRGGPHTEHELTLKLYLPLATTAGENRLELGLSRAAASKLTLQVPTPNASASTSNGNSIPEVVADRGGSRISVLGVGGDFWLAWRGPDQPASKLSSALEATGTVFVKIDGRSVSSEAALTVRSFGDEFDHFRVRLPAGAQLAGGQQPGYTLSPVGDSNASLVEVKLDRKTVGPIEVRLLTERAYDVTKASESLQLSGFAIPEAIPHRQWGHLAVAVSGDWQLVWGDRIRMRQTDELPEGLRRKDIVAGFEYLGQPNSLTARVVSRKTRVSVEPQYTYHVAAERTDLEARLKYTIRGARLFKLDLDLPGWEIDSAGPENVVDANSISTASDGSVTIPLVSPATGELEVTIKAHRANPAGAKLIEWMLPEPRADVTGPAELAIVPAENIDLTPQSDKLVGLSRSTGVPPPSKSQPTALYYRSEQARAKFSADFAVHPQSIKVETEARADLRARQIEVSQSIDYQIRYEPLDRLVLNVPRKLFDERKLRFSLGDEIVEPHEVGEQPAADRRSVQAPLKQPTTGHVRLDVSFVMPQATLSPASSTVIEIPLVVASDSPPVANLAILTPDSGIRIEQREGPWSVVEPPRSAPAGPAQLRLSATEPAPDLRLALSLDDRRAASATFVDRTWIQTWLSKSVRQDRAVYNFVTDAESLRVLLPAGIVAGEVEVALDGKDVAPVTDSPGVLIVNLPPANSVRREHLLAMRYQFEGQGARSGWLAFEFPRFDKQVKVRRTYWQIVLPPDESLLNSGGDLTPEFTWRWRDYGLGFERVPLKEQPQLEQWVGSALVMPGDDTAKFGAAALGDELPQQTNRYLFSAIGAEARFEIVVVRRWLMLLLASLAALLAGFAVIYVPILRKPRILLAAAAFLLIAVLIWPEPAVLLAQAASLGLCLALVAFLLRHTMMLRGGGRDATSSQRALAAVERSSQRVPYRSADGVKTATTTASIAVDVAAPEGEETAETRTGSGPGRVAGGSGSSRRNR